MYEIFCGEVAKQKKLRKLSNADIAKMAGLTYATVQAFMCGARRSDKTAQAIAYALNIKL